MESGPTLLVGTIGNEFQVKSASTIGQPLSPTNLTITPQTGYGSVTGSRALRIGSAVLYIQRSGEKLREMKYDFQTDNFVSRDITILSEHILRNGDNASYIAFQALSMTCIGLCGSNFGAMAMDPVGHIAGTASSVQGFITSIGAVLVNMIGTCPASRSTVAGPLPLYGI